MHGRRRHGDPPLVVIKAWLRFLDWLDRRHVTFFLAAMLVVAATTLYGC